MARPLRIEFPGAVYHVTSRGNAQQNIFLNDTDHKNFLKILDTVVERFNWLVHCYCLMNNHYHLVVETPDANLSRGMRQLNGVYTQKFNWLHNSTGHTFQGRYKSILVEKQSYLLEVCRYVVLNPVRAQLIIDPYNWKWSSYRATAGYEKPIKCLTIDWVLGQFGNRRDEARRSYQSFVKEGIDKKSFGKELAGKIILGTEEFIKAIRQIIETEEETEEVPRFQRYVGRPTLEELFKIKDHADKDSLRLSMKAAYNHGYTMKEIGNHLGIHYATVSRALKRAEKNV